MPTFAQTQAGYRALWDRAQIKPAALVRAKAAAVTICSADYKTAFQAVEAATGVPWFMVGIILYRESDLNLHTYLGNGQPLSRVTTIVPKGRGPFPTFQAGAIDSLTQQGYTKYKIPWTVELVLFSCEDDNGWGYTAHNENSPYIWAGTTLEQKGKYDRDGHFDPNLQDPQLGCAAVLKAIALIDQDVAQFTRPLAAPKEKPVTTAPAPLQLTLNVDWHTLLSGIENQLPTMLGAVPVLAPFKDIVVSLSKILLHADPASMQGQILSAAIDQGLPLLAQFVPQVGPFVSIISMFAKMALNAVPLPVAAKAPIPLTPVQAAQTTP